MLQGNSWYCRYLWQMEALPEMVVVSLYMATPRGYDWQACNILFNYFRLQNLQPSPVLPFGSGCDVSKKPSNC